jgi:hypothetical protein
MRITSATVGTAYPAAAAWSRQIAVEVVNLQAWAALIGHHYAQ